MVGIDIQIIHTNNVGQVKVQCRTKLPTFSQWTTHPTPELCMVTFTELKIVFKYYCC